MTTEHSCPYTAIFTDESSDHEDDVHILEETKRKCPAFEGNQCPFKDAKSSDQVREMIMKVPQSHMDPDGEFFRVMKGMHKLQHSIVDPSFVIQGGCPVKAGEMSFTEALEGSSLSALMARMATELETENIELKHSTKETDHALSESLKTGTAVSHQAAEDVHFVKDFIRGKIDRNLYGKLVIMLYHVYDALEECLDAHAHKTFPSCYFPELDRRESLKEDMDFWHGRIVEDMTPATRDYVDRIRQLAKDDPLLLLSHAYTRYLGDLSGGRILARVARKAMNLGKDGLAFYEFKEIESPKKFKDDYRNALDQLLLSEDEVERLVAEANVAFVLNIRLFEELDVFAKVPGSKVRSLGDALAYAKKGATPVANDKCPFLEQTKNQDTAGKVMKQGKRCPWPFILAHDPKEGMKDWQTWVVLGLLMCLVWSMMNKS